MFSKIKRFIRTNPVLVLLVISLATRLIWLFFGMPSVTNDEADIYASAYIFGRTLHDYWGHFAFLTTGILTAKPSLPVYIGSIPFFFTAAKSVILARLPFVLLNSATPVLLFLLVRRLGNDKRLPYLAFFVFNFSPWFSYPSMTGYEAMVALFFILLFFLTAVSRLPGKWKFFAFILTGFCAFNSYMGMKPVFPFVLIAGFLFYLGVHKTGFTRKKVLQAVAFSLIAYAAFIGINYFAPNATLVKREYQIMLTYYEEPKIKGMVWFERWTSTGPDKLITALSNRYTIRFRDYLSKYFMAFDPQLFFQKGDPSSLYGMADLSGFFFLTDFVFFIIGLLSVASLKDKGLRILLALYFIGGLPIVLSNTNPTFLLRGVILLIPYVLTIALGMTRSLERHKRMAWALGILFILNYALYFTVYNVRIANLNGEQLKYTIKKISDEVASIKDQYRHVTIYNREAQETFLQYTFYEINDPAVIAQHMRDRNYTYKNVTVSVGCPKVLPKRDELVVYNKEDCGEPGGDVKIVDLLHPRDRSGKDYFIFRGK